jgi:O-antigen ligase
VLLSKDRSSLPLASPAVADRQRLLLLLTTAWSMSGGILYILAPLAAPVVLPLCAVAPLVWHWASKGRISWQHPSAVLQLLGLASVYLLINATWSLSQAAAFSEIACLIGFIVAMYLTLSALAATDAAVLRAMALGFVAGVLLAGAFVCFETFSRQAVHRLIFAYEPAWAPAPEHMRMESGAVAFLEPYLLDRNITALVLLFWPAALAIKWLKVARPTKIALLLGLGVLLAAIARSEHTTSKIALIGAAASFALFFITPRLARWAVIAGWTATTLLVVPAASLAYTKQLYLVDWLKGTARQRIVIWGHTSGEIRKAPIFGAGISTARALNYQDDVRAPRAPGSPYRLTTGWHTHNGYLQAWYETGAVGALLLLACGLLVLKSLAAARPGLQPYLFATFVSCALMGGSSYSLWAPWFMASVGLAAVFATLGSELAGRQRQGAGDTSPHP